VSQAMVIGPKTTPNLAPINPKRGGNDKAVRRYLRFTVGRNSLGILRSPSILSSKRSSSSARKAHNRRLDRLPNGRLAPRKIS
jgi:hypothetical protein